jgi:lipid II:glycine glycyltransferase (peptidoglycan interpeptide bridge formation enzyme)
MYGCRGPVCDLDDRETVAELLEGAKQLARTFRSYCIKLDPDVTIDQTAFRDLLTSQGYRLLDEGKNFEGIQPRFVFRLNIEGKSEDELMAFFSSKTRYNIRLAQRKGVEVRLANEAGLDDFAALMLDTGLRDGFVTRPRSYFANILKNLGEHARLFMAYHEGTAIAGTLAIHFGDKVWYLYGASSNAHRNLMPNYLLQWTMIRWAAELGCRIYDFRGVSGDLSEDNPLYGLYRFKRGFNGDFCEFLGEFDLIVNPVVYAAVGIGRKAMNYAMTKRYRFRNRKKLHAQVAEGGDEE